MINQSSVILSLAPDLSEGEAVKLQKSDDQRGGEPEPASRSRYVPKPTAFAILVRT
jgi:hypothetical protein